MRISAAGPALFLLGLSAFLADPVPTSAERSAPRETPTALPLVGFVAEDDRDGISLAWTTDFDEVTATFSVERSVNGNTWSTIGEVACGRDATGPLAYGFRDETPFAGLNHYRLVRHTSLGIPIASAPLGIVHRAAFGLRVWPNPVDRGQPLHLLYDGGEGHEFQIELVDVHGLRLKRWSVESDAGTNQVSVSAEVPEPGNYFLRVFIDDLPVHAFPVFVK